MATLLKKMLVSWILFLVAALVLPGPRGFVAELLVGPVSFGISDSGTINFKINNLFYLPIIPLVALRAGAAFQTEASSLLIIRVNGIDCYYDLQGQSFNVTFQESAMFRAHSIRKQNHQILIEVEQVNLSGRQIPINCSSLNAKVEDEEGYSTNILPDSSTGNCPGAPPTYISVGDTVVLDFDDRSALRILRDPDGGAMDTLGQAYGDNRLYILSGPRCGSYQGRPVWYWYAELLSHGIRGWVAEGISGDRWLCSLDAPECGS